MLPVKNRFPNCDFRGGQISQPLLSGATGADFFPICPNFSHFFPILHIKRSYTVKKIGASLFLTFYHFFPILHIKRSYIYYSGVTETTYFASE